MTKTYMLHLCVKKKINKETNKKTETKNIII